MVMSRISAYPDGIDFTVSSYLHRSVNRRRRRYLHQPMMLHDIAEPGEPIPEELLRFGLIWPDGGRATNLDDWGRSRQDATEPTHGLEFDGGGGSDSERSQDYWAWPLPGPGQLRIVIEWPAFGIDETTGSIDGELLVEASKRARPVWPEDTSKPSHLSRRAIMRATRERHDGPGAAAGGPDPAAAPS